jgi:hypothetical protein
MNIQYRCSRFSHLETAKTYLYVTEMPFFVYGRTDVSIHQEMFFQIEKQEITIFPPETTWTQLINKCEELLELHIRKLKLDAV